MSIPFKSLQHARCQRLPSDLFGVPSSDLLQACDRDLKPGIKFGHLEEPGGSSFVVFHALLPLLLGLSKGLLVMANMFDVPPAGTLGGGKRPMEAFHFE